MGDIVKLIQDAGIDVLHIPGGCTYLCQPLDIGVNKTFKHLLRIKWEDWMDREGCDTMTKSSRALLSEWIVDSYYSIEKKMVINAWKKKGFEWF
jgi:hypothetical protein